MINLDSLHYCDVTLSYTVIRRAQKHDSPPLQCWHL